MEHYINGKIYKIYPIVEHLPNEEYYGSTIQKYLSSRFQGHKHDYIRWKSGGKVFHKISVFDLFDKFGVENCIIELIEDYKATSIEDLRRREGDYQKTYPCINKLIAGRTQQEYRITNLDLIKQKVKIFYNQNRERLLEEKKQYNIKNREKLIEKSHIYYEAHKEELAEKSKIYRENNKDLLKERRIINYDPEVNSQRCKSYREKNKDKILAPVSCECGGTYKHKHKATHFKTAIHQTYENNKDTNT